MMKSFLSLAAIAAAAAAASTPTADVYIFDPEVTATSSPELSKEAARLIFAHRLRDAPDETGSVVHGADSEDLDAHIQTYGKPRQSLFSSQRSQRAPQLVVFLESATSDSTAKLQYWLKQTPPTFTIAEPPSERANHILFTEDFVEYTGSWSDERQPCPAYMAIKPTDSQCWDGDSLIVKYDTKKNSRNAMIFMDSIPQLKAMAKSGELETTIVVLPESSRDSDANEWAPGGSSRLSRRQSTEMVMQFEAKASGDTEAEGSDGVPSGSSGSSPAHVFSGGACYSTRAKCMNETYGCFRHGTCVEQGGCFQCLCNITTKDNFGRVTEWTGDMCQKADVSAEFWMFFGVGLVALISIGGALSLLMGVGNEPLPGVLGAGVVKSK